MRRNDVASTSFRRRVPTRFLINQCQIITFLILKYGIIENSRIELRGIVLPVQVAGLLGGPKGMLAPPLKLLGGPGPPWPPLFLRLCIIHNYDWFSEHNVNILLCAFIYTSINLTFVGWLRVSRMQKCKFCIYLFVFGLKMYSFTAALGLYFHQLACVFIVCLDFYFTCFFWLR